MPWQPIKCRSRSATRTCVVVLAGLVWAGPAAPAGEPCHYTWVELPTPAPGTFLAPEALNNHGVVVGRMGGGGDIQQGFIWSVEEGLRVLTPPPGTTDVRPSDVNDLGHVCGTLADLTIHRYRPFFWDGHTFTVIDVPGAHLADGLGLNNRDQVVGQAIDGGRNIPYLWEAGVLTLLPLVGQPPSAFAEQINDRGQILGWEFNPLHRSCFFGLAGPEQLPLPDGLAGTQPNGMNSRGEALGFGYFSWNPPVGDPRAWIWWSDRTEAVEPPAPYDRIQLVKLNETARAVGFVDLEGASRQPVIWHGGAVQFLYDLAVPRPTRPLGGESGVDINQRGQIVTMRYLFTPRWLPGDITGDCHVTLADLELVLLDFGMPPGTFPRGDVDADSDVDLADLATLLGHWGE